VYTAFAGALGVAYIGESAFHPFFHEIVSVEPAENSDDPPTLTHEYWPGLVAGSLLLIRSGVGIRAGANHLDPEVAARSCLYWAWWRRNRRVVDMSHGWGHNSQWSTNFRRDYITREALYYNVDSRDKPAGQARRASELSEAEHLTLLRHRCSLLVDLGHDQWPYDDFAMEPR
jgi:hypothetical protein